MTLQAHQAHFLTSQHFGIRRAVRLMTASAAFQPDGGVLEREWASLIGVAPVTARLVRSGRLHHSRAERSVRVMAIHTGHDAFGKVMAEWSLELVGGARVAAGALRVDVRRLPRNQAGRTLLMNRMAAHAAHLIFSVAALDPSRMRGLIAVAFEASLLGFFGRLPGRVPYIRRR